MSILSFALRGNYAGFYNELKEISKLTGKSALVMFADTALSTLVFGSGLQDYLNYEFYEKSYKERSSYVTIGNMAKAYKKLAPIKYADFISNKVNFNKNYAQFTKRDFLSCDNSFDEFEQFLAKHPTFVKKPLQGCGGAEVTKMTSSEISDKKDFYEHLKAKEFFLEELIIQHEAWATLSPNSTNTLRVMTEAFDNSAKIIFAAARIGSGKSITDNFHQGGMGVLVDLETGELTGNGVDKKLNESETSVSGIKFDGFVIPYWDEIKQMVIQAALVNDNIHIVGWDVAITPNGPLLIEGNRGPGFDLVQMLLKKGTKYMLDDAMAKVE